MKRITIGHHSLSIPSIVLLHFHDESYSLYRVLTLMAKTYTETLLKDKSAPGGHFTAYIRSSPS